MSRPLTDVLFEVDDEAGSKLRDDARIKVDYYVTYDPTQQLSDEPLPVYELREGRYVRRSDTSVPGVGLRLIGVYEGVREGYVAALG